MPKKFYTEKDIEELFNSGITSLKINDNVQLTGMAYEKAHRLGLHLLTDGPDTPPGAPVRPYLSGGGTVHSAPTAASTALSMSVSSPSATSAQTCSVEGSMEAIERPEWACTHSPPI